MAKSKVDRSFEALALTNIHNMTRSERTRVHQKWMADLDEALRCEAIQLISAHSDSKHELDRTRSEVDLRCLAEADVIGVTTSGLASNLKMLQKLQAKVVICEEAGEVMESHLLTALIPSVEHAIFIGDHLQLRPQVQNYDLSRENPNGGDRYSIDVSLFERLVSPTSAFGSGLPYTTLQTQRRMHPSIARLVRDTLYPDLVDADNVSEYPRVSGMKKRLFWLDHRCYEEGMADDTVTPSRWNSYEVDMTVALVNHILNQGDYKAGDIAVLTPYLGQLYRLRKSLSQHFTICLSERDQDELGKAGLELDDGIKPTMKSSLLDALRVATVNNFQGEEAKIVVISLVRSNPQNRCGFLSTSNRINVLLSRAQHGMYIIGNSETSIHVPMWEQVIGMLKEDDNFGPNLHLECPRHSDALIMVSEPSHFLQFSPEGGCNLRCSNRLSCGHVCEQRCHSDMLHNAVLCRQPCPKVRKWCTHPCPEICGNPCPFDCTELVTRKGRNLPCGHTVETLPCYQDQDLTKARCKQIVRKVIPRCQHEVSEPCHLDVSATTYKCKSRCMAQLPCGHQCSKKCHECSKSDKYNHGKCRQKCGRNYSTCRHACKAFCHGNEPCPPCNEACEVRCAHSICTRKCFEPCVPCAEEKCLSACPHSKCTLPCAAPCNHIPCSKRCPKTLSCGHQCPSICGEQCPNANFCQICTSNDVKNHAVDFILGRTYQELNLDISPCIFPSCGHFLTAESMDNQMELAKYYTLDNDLKPVAVLDSVEPFRMEKIKSCALCRGQLRDLARYGRLVRQALLDESTKKFVLFLNREYLPLAEDLARAAQHLQDMEYKQRTPLPAVISIQGSRSEQVRTMKGALGNVSINRWGNILKVRDRIDVYRRRVSPAEQPHIRVLSMVEAARRRQDPLSTDSFKCEGKDLHVKGTLLATALSLRLDIALLTDLLLIKGQKRGKLTVNLAESRREALNLITTAQDSKRPPLEAEGHIYLAQLHALERCHCTDYMSSKTHLDSGLSSLDKARSILVAYPVQTRGLESEIDAAENMFLSTFYSIVTNAERLAVVRAMAGEFVGTGHWYYCRNRHPFTIGECGGAVQEGFCSECGAPVGGRQHRVVEGVRPAEDLEGPVEW